MKHLLTFSFLFLTALFIGCDDNDITQPVENSSKTLYVLNSSAETISKINMEDLTITKDVITTGSIPNRIRVFDDRVYVVSSGDDNIKVIDPNSDTEILVTIGLDAGSNPWDIAFVSPNKGYVTNYNTNSVSIVDLNNGSVSKTIAVGIAPEGLVYKDGFLYVTNTGYSGYGMPYTNSSVSIIDVTTDQVVGIISTPINPQDLAFAPDGKLHVVCTGDYATEFGKIAVIDIATKAVIDTVVIGGAPGDIEITNDGIAYCCAWGDGVNGFLYSYDTSSKTVFSDNSDPVRVGANLSQIYYDSTENSLWIPYMAEWAGDGFIQKFDVSTNKIVWNSEVVGNGTSALAIYETID